MSYKNRDRLRWAVALYACVWSTYHVFSLELTIGMTWLAAEMFSPDEKHLEPFTKPISALSRWLTDAFSTPRE